MSLINKVYTAQDMRDAAKCLFACEVDLEHDNRDIAQMLRQAARMLEREKSYEYAVKIVRDGHTVGISAGHYETPEKAEKSLTYCPSGETPVVVRRAVGDWEDVPT